MIGVKTKLEGNVNRMLDQVRKNMRKFRIFQDVGKTVEGTEAITGKYTKEQFKGKIF